MAFDGMILRDKTLFFTVADNPRIPSVPGPSAAVRVLYRQAPLVVDGKTQEWHKFPTISWVGPEKIEGEALISHDGQNLHVGLSIKGARRDTSVELAFKVGDRHAHWSLSQDGEFSNLGKNNKGVLVPTDARAAVNEENDVIVYEMAIPLNTFVPKRQIATSRLNLELSVIDVKKTKIKKGVAPLVKLQEELLIHTFTPKQESTALAAARALPDLQESWQLREDSIRHLLPLGDNVTTADLYREFIIENPKDRGVRQALLQLAALTKHSEGDQSQHIGVCCGNRRAGVGAPLVQTVFRRIFVAMGIY